MHSQYELTNTEKLVLAQVNQESNTIVMIPVDIFVSLLYYLESKENYESCAKLMLLIDKVKLQTTMEFLDYCVKDKK